MPAPNTRVQRTRSSPSAPRSPLTRHPLDGLGPALLIVALSQVSSCASSSGGKPVHQSPTPGVTYSHHDSPSQAPVPVEITCDSLVPPELISRVDPAYPSAVRQQRLKGTVVMKCIIDSAGAVSDVVVSESPSQVLSDLAVPAVRQWRYKPAYCKDQEVPVSVYLSVTVTFGL